jgi:hypothetical protein
VIRLAKLALWALQGDRMASAWHPCDDHVCGAVAISAGKKKDREKQKIGRNRDTTHFPWPPTLLIGSRMRKSLLSSMSVGAITMFVSEEAMNGRLPLSQTKACLSPKLCFSA